MLSCYNGGPKGGVDMPKLIEMFQVENEIIEIWQYWMGDFEIHYRTSGGYCRGTLVHIMRDLNNCFGVFDD